MSSLSVFLNLPALKVRSTPYVLLLISCAFLTGCKKQGISQDKEIPVSPSNLSAKAVSMDQIELNWTDNSTNESGFKIERKSPGVAYSEIATVTKDIDKYSDKNLTAGTTYTYRVYAYHDKGKSETYTNEATATILDNSPDINTGLIAYYPFSGDGGDSSGNGYHAQVLGPTLTADRFNQPNRAYVFSNITDKVYLDNSKIQPQSFTVSVWCKVVVGWTYSTGLLLSIGTTDNTSSTGFNLSIDQNNVYGTGKYKIIGNVFTSSLKTARSNAYDFNFLNKWNHFVLVRDAGMIKIYVNGLLDATTTITGDLSYSQTNLRIGNQSNINNLSAGNRIVDDVRIYNRVLTDEQISYLYTK